MASDSSKRTLLKEVRGKPEAVFFYPGHTDITQQAKTWLRFEIIFLISDEKIKVKTRQGGWKIVEKAWLG